MDDHIPVLLRLDHERNDGGGRQSGRGLACFWNGNSTHTPGTQSTRTVNPFKLALFDSITDPSGAQRRSVQLPQQPAER